MRTYDAHRIGRRLRSLCFPNSQRRTGLQPTAEVNPFVIPFYDIPGVQKINDSILRKVLHTRIKNLDFRDFIILSATPMIVDVIGTLGESSSHYFCLDDYSCYDGAYRCIGKLEEKMLGSGNIENDDMRIINLMDDPGEIVSYIKKTIVI